MANEFKIKNGLIVSGSADFEQDLRVRGTLTVDELHTSITSSSILYESGSTVFGNTLDDTHQLTGSVAITGSITLNGQAIGTGKLDEITFNSFTSSYTTGAFTGSFTGSIIGKSSENLRYVGIWSGTTYGYYLVNDVVKYNGSLYYVNNDVYGNGTPDSDNSFILLSDITPTGSFLTTGSFNTFTSSYNTGSFTGSFIGDGSQLTNIPSSGVTGLNLSKIISGSVSASISPDKGLEINTNTTITGSLTVSGSTLVDYIIFNSQSVTPLVGYMLQANSVDKTLDLRMGDNNATLQLGQEMYFPPVVNKSGENLNDGDLVMVNPSGIAQGNRISVVKAVTDGTYPADKIVGILTEDLAVNQEGFATWFGYVRNLNKTQVQPAGETWAEGDILYPNPAIPGRLTKVFPTPPNLRVTVATITAINGNNVTLLVNFHKRTSLKRAHDVLDNSTTSSYGDLLMKSGSVWTNSKTLLGDYTISGTTTLGGNIVPLSPRGATLGTLELPFADIFVSSGSINIAGIVGQPNTTLSNVSGNILISAGGMQLVGSGAFNAATGSFQFISGSMEQVGDYTQTGDYELLGNKSITGSLNLSGSLNITSLITGATTDNIVTYNPTTKAVGSITGLTASQIPVRYYGAFYDLTTQTGATNVSGSVRLGNTQHANGVSVVSGSRVTIANAGVYNLQFSTQLYRSSGGQTVTTYFWFRVNGVNVTNSNTAVTTNANNGYTVASWNYVDVYNAGDYVELIWMPDGDNVSLQYLNNPLGSPSIPSVILTITQV